MDNHVDYVLVINRNSLTVEKNVNFLTGFFKYLENRNININVDKSNDKHFFITLSLSYRALVHYAKIYDVNITSKGHTNVQGGVSKMVFFDTFLTQNRRDFFLRNGEATTAERIIIMHKILINVEFNLQKQGIDKAIKLGYIKAAFPLHDGPYEFNSVSSLSSCSTCTISETSTSTHSSCLQYYNDRELLAKYWASFRLWYKKQPLNLIEKYYGPEVAFYFAWVGFYNQMLIPAAVFGTLLIIINLFLLFTTKQEQIEQICGSNLIMCPVCYISTLCRYRQLNSYCSYSKFTFIVDNNLSFIYAIFISLWASMFLILWERKENMLKLRWNVEYVDVDMRYRPEFYKQTKYRRLSALTDRLEPYVPKKIQIFNFLLTLIVFFLLFIVVLLIVFMVIAYRVSLRGAITIGKYETLKEHLIATTMTTGSIIQVVFIKLFEKLYKPIARWLTEREMPKTQYEYDMSLIYKQYFIAFINNYSCSFYIAFIRGALFSTPNNTHWYAFLASDSCNPSGCITGLFIQLSFILLWNKFLGNIWLSLKHIVHKYSQKQIPPTQWEEEYKMKPITQDILNSSYMSLVIQYGFVTLFGSAFPLGPLCALITNTLEMRLMAARFVKTHRRPVPKKVSGLGPWKDILKGITYLGMATNAYILAFTSYSVYRTIYWFLNNYSLKGFTKTTFSIFAAKDFIDEIKNAHGMDKNITHCYYSGTRYPPHDSRKYQLTTEYWNRVGLQLVAVIGFQHLLFIFNKILSCIISDVPKEVRDKLAYRKLVEIENKRRKRPSK